MSNTRRLLRIEDIHFTEKEKSNFDYLQSKMDYYIQTLVHEKTHIKKCRNLYEGVRDKEEFQYLESTFGIESPIGLKMTPLIKTRIDILIGIFLDENKRFLVSVNDAGTHDKIKNSKKDLLVRKVIERYNKAVVNSFENAAQGQPPSQEEQDPVTAEFMKKMEDSINDDFISEFEIAAQTLITHFKQNNGIDLEQKLKLMFLDLLVTGECFFRAQAQYLGDDPKLTVHKPENIFFNKNSEEQKLNTDAVVCRRFMKRSQVLAEHGHLMSPEAKDELFGSKATEGRRIASGYELDYSAKARDNRSSLHEQFTYDNNEVIEVLEVEWIATTEVKLSEQEQEFLDFVETTTISKDAQMGFTTASMNIQKSGIRQDRYVGIRAGGVYFGCGKAKHQIRSEHNPFKTELTFRGIGYNERNGRAYSMAWSLKDLQDLFDISTFHRDNLIALSGVNGSRVNLAGIPKVLGENFMERLQKFIAYRKQGLELVDPTEPGAQLFNQAGDFRGSVDATVIGAIEQVLQSIERQADIVSGVNRFMYQAAEQRDAVSNVTTGIKQTSLITKDIFELMNSNITQLLIDMINVGKITYKYGKKGSYILGGKSYLFDLLPENFTFTDYNINIVNSQAELVKMEKISGTAQALINGNMLDPELALMISGSESTTDIMRMTKIALAKAKEEGFTQQKAAQQIEELEKALEDQQKQLTQYEGQIKAISDQGDAIKREKLAWDKERFYEENTLREKAQSVKEKLANSEIKKDIAVVELEREQIYAENGTAREVKNDL